MGPWVRSASSAFLAATIASLVIDGVLQTLIGVASVASPNTSSSWWATAHLVERGRWVALAALVTLATRGVGEGPHGRRDVWRATGMAVVTIPLLWVLANWIVTVILFTLAGRWDIDGRVFLEAGYYRALLVDYVPWLLGGAGVVAASSHVD